MTEVRGIAIVGGGLGGLAAANALAMFGFETEVFEQSPAVGEIGAGISISSQAVKALRAIGVGEKLAAVGNASEGIQTRNMQTGEPLEFRPSPALRYGAPHYFVHRADLLNALASGLDPATVHLDHRLTAIEERPSSVTLTFANGVTRQADIVIGADGVHSVIRRALYGDDKPTYTGQSVWRSLLKGSEVPSEVLEPSGSTQWWGPGCHLVSYYLRGRDVVNVVTQDDTDQWVEEGWSIPGDPDEMRASFPNPEPRLKTLLSLVTQCSRWGLFTRPLTSDWGRDRIQLIGDAAHAMLPNAGQGAAQSFEDAYTLARWLDAERSDPAEALRRFRRIRIPRVHGVQRASLAAARMKHMRDRDVQKDTLAKAGGNIGFGWIWEYDPVASWDKVPVVPAIE
jgi:2-polyprenyl-6-methoxyphenol hydroxylase-like FAD-dependent oxidoreductase